MYTPYSDRRHLNPRCCCPECRAFDQSATLPMQPISTNPVMMDTLDTETGERCTCYYHPGSSHPYLLKTPSADRRDDQKNSRKSPFRAFLRALVRERIEKGIDNHPFFWLCMATLFC